MPRFNFTEITLQSNADITEVMDNFNKIEQNAVLLTDLATITKDGLMAKEDKVKINSIEQGANNYVLPTAGLNQKGGVQTTSNVSSNVGYIAVPIINGVPYYHDTTYAKATYNDDGLMSKEDKYVLDNLLDEAKAYTDLKVPKLLYSLTATENVTSLLIDNISIPDNTDLWITAWQPLTGGTSGKEGFSLRINGLTSGDGVMTYYASHVPPNSFIIWLTTHPNEISYKTIDVVGAGSSPTVTRIVNGSLTSLELRSRNSEQLFTGSYLKVYSMN